MRCGRLYRGITYILLASSAPLGLFGCSSGDDGGGSTASVSVSGTGQKGPFQPGATVTATQLNSDGTQTNSHVSATVGTDGDFNLSGLGWSDPTEVEVSGTYFNENAGTFSSDTRTLRTILDASGAVNANVNLYTHLLAARIQTLMASGQSLGNARSTALGELQTLVGIGSRPENLDLADAAQSGNASDSANLLLFSAAVLAAGLNQAQIDAIASDFGDDGQINGSATSSGEGQSQWQQVQQAASNNNLLSNARSNIQSQYGTTPPAFSGGGGGGSAGWMLSACESARLGGHPVICPTPGDTLQGTTANTGNLNRPIQVIPEAPGFYYVSVSFDNSPGLSGWTLYSTDDGSGTFSGEVGSANTEDITDFPLRAGETYYLPVGTSSSPEDFTAFVGRVSEGTESAPFELSVGETHSGRIGQLISVSATNVYRIEPRVTGVRRIEVNDKGQFGYLAAELYADSQPPEETFGSNETLLETAGDSQSNVQVIEEQLTGGETYFLIVKSRLNSRVSFRPAPGHDELEISIQ